MANKDLSRWFFRRKVPLRGDRGFDGVEGPGGPIGPIGATGSAGTPGANGVRGSVWTVSAGAPVGVANANDMHLNSTNGDVYTYTTSWGLVGNIKGVAGATGGTGPAGLPNITSFSAAPGRTFNTNFTPHATRPTICAYAVQLHTVLTAIGTSFAQVQMMVDPSGTPATVVSTARHQRVLGLGISINEQSDVISSVYCLVPPGYAVRLVPATGNGGTATFVSQAEIVL